MRLVVVLSVLIAAIVVTECSHTFMGSNVLRRLAYNRKAKYSSSVLQKRIEYFNYTLPIQSNNSQVIQGILAYDLTGTTASANVTGGGVGSRFVNLRMKSDRGKNIDYDIYIYV